MMRDEAPGFPFFLPNGMMLKNTLLDYWREIHHKAGYVEISTPHDHEQAAVEDLRPLGPLQGQHVLHRHRRRGLLHQADELPRRRARLQAASRTATASCPCACRRARHWCTATSCAAPCTACSACAASTRTTRTSSCAPTSSPTRSWASCTSSTRCTSKFGFKYHVELSTRPEDSMGSDEDWEAARERPEDALWRA